MPAVGAPNREIVDVPTSVESRRSRTMLYAAGAGGAVVAVIVIVAIAMRGGGSPSTATNPEAANRAEVDRHLDQAAARIRDGKLVGPGGDTAIDHLIEAKRLSPGDKQALAQLHALADTFEKLGDGAAAAGDLAEAAAHLQAALTAEPERASAATKLKEVEQRARGGTR